MVPCENLNRDSPDYLVPQGALSVLPDSCQSPTSPDPKPPSSAVFSALNLHEYSIPAWHNPLNYWPLPHPPVPQTSGWILVYNLDGAERQWILGADHPNHLQSRLLPVF